MREITSTNTGETSIARRAVRPSGITVLRHQAGETLKHWTPDLSGKNLVRGLVALVAGGVASPFLEPVITGQEVSAAATPNVEVRQEIPTLIWVDHNDPNNPEKTKAWQEQKEIAKTYFREVLSRMATSGVPEFQMDVREFLSGNGKPPQSTGGTFTEKQYLDIVLSGDPNKPATTSFVAINAGVEITNPQFNTIFLLVADNLRSNDPGDIQTALYFHEVILRAQAMKTSARAFDGSGDDLVAELIRRKPEMARAEAAAALSLYRRLKNEGVIGTVYKDSPKYSQLSDIQPNQGNDNLTVEASDSTAPPVGDEP